MDRRIRARCAKTAGQSGHRAGQRLAGRSGRCDGSSHELKVAAGLPRFQAGAAVFWLRWCPGLVRVVGVAVAGVLGVDCVVGAASV